jgi:phosphoadenosine phosphosulfate reductase
MLYIPPKAIAELSCPVIAFFSTGKDSIVSLDILLKRVKEIHIVHLYFYKKISIRESVLRYYESRYGVTIHRLPHPERIWFYKRMGKDVKTNTVINDIEPYLCKKFGTRWLSYGHRLAESLTRRAMLKRFKDGIDVKTGRVYPVLYFKKNHIKGYVKKEKLILPDDYQFFDCDINIFKGDPLVWLFNNHYEDYLRIKEEWPFIEEDYRKAVWQRKRQ